MATVKIGAISSLWKTTPEENGIIFHATSAQVPGAFFMPHFQNGSWDGFNRFYRPRTKTLPSGLVPDAIQALEENGFEVEVIEPDVRDLGPRPGAEIYYDITEEHQVKALEAMMTSKRGILHAATNAGKTKIAQAWCALNDCKVLYLVPRRELLDQTYESFKKDTNLRVGKICAFEEWEIGEDVTVALMTSVSRRKSRMSGSCLNQDTIKRIQKVAKLFEAVIVDECHHLSGESYRGILKRLVNCHYRYGLSGSPWEYKDEAAALQVKSLLGPIIAHVSNSELIEKGWSAKPIINMIPIQSEEIKTLPREAGDMAMDFSEVYEEGIVYNTLRNNVILKLCQSLVLYDKPTLIVSLRLPQCQILSELLSFAKIKHRVITGDPKKREERKDDLRDFKDGLFPVLISNVMGEGVDIPILRAIILASGGKSTKQGLQRIGRGLRRKLDGKNEVEIYDFIDEPHPYLLSNSLQRIKLYEREGFNVRESPITF